MHVDGPRATVSRLRVTTGLPCLGPASASSLTSNAVLHALKSHHFPRSMLTYAVPLSMAI